MAALDQWIVSLAGGTWTIIVVALLLGLRHATDPDHLTAVSTLILSDARHGVRRANLLGLFWGIGHAITLFVFGLPIILFRQYLPLWVQRGAEFTIGLTIAVLAARLLLRWRHGYFHVHPHTHGGLPHAHPHAHEKQGSSPHPQRHAHPHQESIGRSPVAALGIGMVHGVGGSAGVGILLLAAVPQKSTAVLALLSFAAATALSMALVSSVFGLALARGPLVHRMRSLIPLLGLLSLVFGVWYSVNAIS